jgi:anti-anti-sigma factor
MTTEPLMTVVATRIGAATVLTVAGEVDLHTAPELVDAVSGTPGGMVVADLTGVAFLSSAGLGALASLATRLGDHGVALRLVAGENKAVTRPWTAMHLGDILPLYPDLASALA